MESAETRSIPELIRDLLRETRELIHEELALARAEIRAEVGAVRTVGIVFGSAIIAALLGTTLLCIAVGSAIAYAFTWPVWTGYGIVAVLLLVTAFGFTQYGRGRLKQVRALPKTTQTLKENLAWIQSKSAEK